MKNTTIQEEENNSIKEVIDMLFFTTKKTELDEEEIIKESGKRLIGENKVKEAINQLVKEKFIVEKNHKVFSKK